MVFLFFADREEVVPPLLLSNEESVLRRLQDRVGQILEPPGEQDGNETILHEGALTEIPNSEINTDKVEAAFKNTRL